MNNPLISVIIPSYNRGELISETLNSILNQTYNNWECIIIDDGSLDDTQSIVDIYLKKDSRFIYFRRPDTYRQGGNGARNFGLKISNGELVNFFDSDDLMDPNKFKLQLDALLKNPNNDFSICQTLSFNSETKEYISEWNSQLYDKDLINKFVIKEIGWSILAPLWKKDSLIKNNLKFDEELKNGQDFKFHLEALLKGLKPVVVNQVLVFNREHINQIKSKKNKAFSKSIIFKFLLENKNQLSPSTIAFLQVNLVNLIPRLYLDKNYNKAKETSFFVIKNFSTLKTFFYVFYYAIFGYLNKYTNKGYRFLKVKYKK